MKAKLLWCLCGFIWMMSFFSLPARAQTCKLIEGGDAVPMQKNWHLVSLRNEAVVIDADGNIINNFGKVEPVQRTSNGYFIRTRPDLSAIDLLDARGKLIKNLSNYSSDEVPIVFALAFPKPSYKVRKIPQEKMRRNSLVQNSSKIGLIDRCGSEITEFMYEDVEQIGQHFHFKLNGKWGIFDANKKQLIEPIYDDIYGFQEIGGQIISSAKRGGKWGIIDINNSLIVPFEFDELGSISAANGLATAKRGTKWGFVNLKGEFVIALKFDNVHPFYSENEAEVMIAEIDPIDGKRLKKWGIVNEKGDWILEPKYLEPRHAIGFQSPEINKYGHRIIDGELKGVIDRQDKVIIPQIYQELLSFDNIERGDGKQLDLLMYKFNEKWGLLSANGEKITEPIYDEMSRYDYLGETAVVIRGHKVGYINKNGEEIIPPQFEMAENFYKSDLAPVLIEGKMGFINKKGEIIIMPIFDNTFCPTAIFDQIDYSNPEDCRLKRDRQFK